LEPSLLDDKNRPKEVKLEVEPDFESTAESERVEVPKAVEIPKETLEFFNDDELRARVFYEKYALKDLDGNVVEKTPIEMWIRVAHELASVEQTEEARHTWEKNFYWLLKDFKFVPGGRIMFGAGQPRRSTLLNCLRGDTPVLVRRSVEVTNSVPGYNNSTVPQTMSIVNTVESLKIKDIVGKQVEVLTPCGWSSVIFQSFGTQRLYKITVKNGDTFFATGNHQWVVRANKQLVKKTTKELMTYKGDKGLVVFLPGRPVKDRKYYDGVVHGIVYCKGSKSSKSKYCCKTDSVLLFGAQRELAKYFPYTHEHSGKHSKAKGALCASNIRSQYDLKKLPPVSETSSYWYGFISGYLATDGWVDRFGLGAGINSRNREDLEIIKSQLGRVGLLGDIVFPARKNNRYNGPSTPPLYRLSFWRASISDDLFLRSDHFAKFGKSNQSKKRWTIGISSIEETDIEDEVFCCVEPLTHTFVLGNGILTGNCYFIPIKEDSLESIFDFCKEAGRTYSFGGGVGTDISILRPKGAPVNNSAIVSTGSVSFMELFSVTTGTIGQAGRRGALMITIHVDHPDVLDFIDIKRDISRVTHANISVCVTDEFMRAVENDTEFELRFENDKAKVRKSIRARFLWDKLVRSARDSAEPGLIFWDSVKNESPTEYNGMEVHGFNPCSEQCLEDFGCCCLGNINLNEFVIDEFSPTARIDWLNLEKAIRYAVRFLDNVLDYNSDKHPLPEQTKASLWSRRIGVGFTGLADMLIKLNIKYDEPSTVRFLDKMFERVKNVAYEASSDYAAEKGSFPAFDLTKHMSRQFVQRLDGQVKEKIKNQGLRNSCILTVPPVGSGAILAGTTSGIEPIFALSYIRKSKSLSGSEFKVFHPLVKTYMDKFGLKDEAQLPNTFVTAHKINPEFRVQVQAAVQRHIDSSISSTVNLPENTTVEEVKNIYFQAWKSGCKGITVYREGSREGILLTEEMNRRKSSGGQVGGGEESPRLQSVSKMFQRPKILSGQTIKLKLAQGSIFITVNRNGDNLIREVFVTLGKSGGDEKADAEAIGRLISLYLQHGGDLKEVIHTLKGIQGRDVTWDEGMQLMSIPDAVAKALEKLSGTFVEVEPQFRHCPECGESSLIYENGCYRCVSCGWSKCY
jgi:ribonucleoside-diphosphate reductase alpha chain